MPAFSRILLCYDATREGRQALIETADLAARLQAQAHLVAVLENRSRMSSHDAMSSAPIEASEEAAREILREGVETLAARDVWVIGHLAVGDPVQEISRLASALDADLIVVGHHRSGVLSRWWTSQADKRLLDHVRCSVLVVSA